MGTLGLYSLAGIIINNAIILIDRIDLEREMGKKIYDAIVSACQQRLRPIIITTLTTTLGLLTLIIPHDPLFYGLANIIAYGLAVGTFLTLAVVPVLYSLMFKDKKVFKKQS
jgi:multidrug efflux pump subunit AcrB